MISPANRPSPTSGMRSRIGQRERGVGAGVPLYVYLVDHGLVDHFKADGDLLAKPGKRH